MTNSTLKIWSNVRYDDAAMELLRAETAQHQLIVTEAKDGAALAEADVAFGQPDVEAVKQSARLRWVHLDSAGYDRFDNDEVRAALGMRGAVLTNSSGVYDEPCAQHALAMIMSLARRIPHARDRQLGDHSWPMMELRAETYLLNGQTALLLGFGAIARRLVELLTPLRMNLIAMRRRPTGDEAIPVIAEGELDAHLPRADHVVNLLPMSAATRHFVNAARLAAMKRPTASSHLTLRAVTLANGSGRCATFWKTCAASPPENHSTIASSDVELKQTVRPTPIRHPRFACGSDVAVVEQALCYDFALLKIDP
jgi:phosphoglycerate dehydrogenase-like enzyme